MYVCTIFAKNIMPILDISFWILIWKAKLPFLHVSDPDPYPQSHILEISEKIKTKLLRHKIAISLMRVLALAFFDKHKYKSKKVTF